MSRASHLTPHQVERRYMVLSALRWLPNGLWVSVMVLLLLERGHSLATIGGLFALYAAVVTLCELPTGGLADVIGRKPVLLAASAISAAGLALFAVARPLWQMAVAAVLAGIGRALASGPLEAWFVDAVHAADPAADLTTGLGRGGAATYAALATGAVTGGLTALLARGDAPDDSSLVIWLSMPALAGAAVWVVHGIAVVVLLVEERTPSRRFSDVVRQSKNTVGQGIRLAGRSAVLRRILVSGALIGPVAYAVEALMPAQVESALTDPALAPLVYGIALAASYVGGAFGAGVAARTARRAGSPARGAIAAFLVTAAAVAIPAIPAVGLLVVCVAFALHQASLAAIQPLHSALLHEQVTAEHRATALSVYSLSQHGAQACGGFLLTVLAARGGLPAGWLACAGVLLLAATPLAALDRLRGAVPSGALPPERCDSGAARGA